MNIDYLYSIINLYLKNEKDNRKTNLNIRKMDDVIAFNFNMDENDLDKTSFTVDLNIIMENMNNILNTYKDKLMIIDEKFNKNNGSHYIVMFQNGRKISFDNFSLLEINNIRNILYDINIYSEEIRLDDISQEKKMVYVPKKELQQAGFASFATLFLVALFLTDVFVIALWIFKVLSE